MFVYVRVAGIPRLVIFVVLAVPLLAISVGLMRLAGAGEWPPNVRAGVGFAMLVGGAWLSYKVSEDLWEKVDLWIAGIRVRRYNARRQRLLENRQRGIDVVIPPELPDYSDFIESQLRTFRFRQWCEENKEEIEGLWREDRARRLRSIRDGKKSPAGEVES